MVGAELAAVAEVIEAADSRSSITRAFSCPMGLVGCLRCLLEALELAAESWSPTRRHGFGLRYLGIAVDLIVDVACCCFDHSSLWLQHFLEFMFQDYSPECLELLSLGLGQGCWC